MTSIFMATFFPYNFMHNHNHPFNICSNNDLLLKQSLPYILIPSFNLFITLQPSRKRSDVDLVKSMDSTVVSNSPVDRLFCVVEDVSLRCVVWIIDTLDIQLMSARVDIRSTTNQHRENLFLLPWVQNAQNSFVTEIFEWTNSQKFGTFSRTNLDPYQKYYYLIN